MSHIDEGLLHEYIDGQGSESERVEIERHLSTCKDCLARLHEAETAIHGTSKLLGQLESGPVTPPPWREIEARAAARARPATRRMWLKPSLAWAASIAIAFGVGFFTNAVVLAPREVARVATLTEIPAVATSRSETLDETRPMLERSADKRDVAPTAAGRSAEMEEAKPAAKVSTRGAAELPAGAAQRQVAGALKARESDRIERAGAPAAAEPLADRADAPAQEREQLARKAANEPANRAKQAEQDPEADARTSTGPRRALEAGRRRLAEMKDDLAAVVTNAVKVTGDAVSADESALPPAPRFFQVGPDEATDWLGGEVRALPELSLQRVEVGPGDAAHGEFAGRPIVRLTYEDAAGLEIVLTQQRLTDAELSAEEQQPTLLVSPNSATTYRWHDGRGYRLTLTAAVSSDSLRALAERVR